MWSYLQTYIPAIGLIKSFSEKEYCMVPKRGKEHACPVFLSGPSTFELFGQRSWVVSCLYCSLQTAGLFCLNKWARDCFVADVKADHSWKKHGGVPTQGMVSAVKDLFTRVAGDMQHGVVVKKGRPQILV